MYCIMNNYFMNTEMGTYYKDENGYAKHRPKFQVAGRQHTDVTETSRLEFSYTAS